MDQFDDCGLKEVSRSPIRENTRKLPPKLFVFFTVEFKLLQPGKFKNLPELEICFWLLIVFLISATNAQDMLSLGFNNILFILLSVWGLFLFLNRIMYKKIFFVHIW